MTAPADNRISDDELEMFLSAVPKWTIDGKLEVRSDATMTVSALVVDAVFTELRERRAQAVAPIGYVFELARSVVVKAGAEKRWADWGPQQFGFTEPRVPEGAIRNLRPVYATPPPAQAAGVTEEMNAAGYAAINALVPSMGKYLRVEQMAIIFDAMWSATLSAQNRGE